MSYLRLFQCDEATFSNRMKFLRTHTSLLTQFFPTGLACTAASYQDFQPLHPGSWMNVRALQVGEKYVELWLGKSQADSLLHDSQDSREHVEHSYRAHFPRGLWRKRPNLWPATHQSITGHQVGLEGFAAPKSPFLLCCKVSSASPVSTGFLGHLCHLIIL